MEIHGENIIGREQVNGSGRKFRAFDPSAGKPLEPEFFEATEEQVDRALSLAEEAVGPLQRLSAEEVAGFLLAIREEITALGDGLLKRASEETGLDEGRLKGERDRTLNQIRMFADLVTEGSWVDARIETALPDRKPLPKPDLRRMLQPMGPVVVFGASNFPLAFSVAGGDTISAFAARNPVVVKAHPSHPGTSELVAGAVRRAVEAKSLPEGTFSMLHAKAPEISIALVSHPKAKAVGFTGSERAGRALFDAAARRPQPIPVYAEMGSVNPVFILPGALASNGKAVAEGLVRSVTLGMGQFCTCPGLVFGVESESLQTFRESVIQGVEQVSPATMLNPGIADAYSDKWKKAAGIAGVESHVSTRESEAKTAGKPGVLVAPAETWLENHALQEEIFGPSTIVVHCASEDELLKAANSIEGTLTATIHGTPEDLSRNKELIDVLTRKAGRLIFNGFPTGVEVNSAMQHGGPYPSTTDSKFTSVGTGAILRFARPVAYQNFPENVLPPELQNANPRGIWRTVNGTFTRDAV